MSKTLRAFEEAKSERISLQNTLNSTRLTNSKLRDELNAVEKRATALETECGRLREMMVVAQQSVEALEATKTEHHAELVARRTQIADLQRRVQEQGNDLQITRDENRRITERADRMPFDAPGDVDQQLQIFHATVAGNDALQHAIHPTRALAARCALATRFGFIEARQALERAHHAADLVALHAVLDLTDFKRDLSELTDRLGNAQDCL